MKQRSRLYALGHSTRTLEFFVGLLLGYEIGCLVDIRTIPRSRFNPQFNRETLPANLDSVGISYRHMPGLGGLRRAKPDSINTVPWRCHRSLVADALTLEGCEVRQIMSRVSAPIHKITPWAKVKENRLIYV
jgi:uncharacterized protein (DUF488 family)